MQVVGEVTAEGHLKAPQVENEVRYRVDLDTFRLHLRCKSHPIARPIVAVFNREVIASYQLDYLREPPVVVAESDEPHLLLGDPLGSALGQFLPEKCHQGLIQVVLETKAELIPRHHLQRDLLPFQGRNLGKGLSLSAPSLVRLCVRVTTV